MKKSLRVLAGVATILAFTACMTGCLSSNTKKDAPAAKKTETKVNADARVIKIANGGGVALPNVIAQMEIFKKEVEEGTKGRYKVEVYHDSQLGDDTKSVEGLKAGTIEMSAPSTAPIVGLCKELAVFDLPYLFTSYEMADSMLDGKVGQELAKKVDQVEGLKLLGWWELGFRDLTNSIKEVHTPADVEGMKIRTMDNKYHLQIWSALGAHPTAISGAEIFTSLQQHVVDGQENPITNLFSQQIHTVNKYISKTEHVYSPTLVLMSKKVWDSISPEDQKVFLKATKDAGAYERKLNRDKEKECIEKMKGLGNVITDITPDQKKLFEEKTKPVWDTIAKDVGPDIINLIKAEREKFLAKSK